MHIENARYVKDVYTNEKDAIACDCDGRPTSIPLDPANRHYAEIMRQVAAGTLTIADAD